MAKKVGVMLSGCGVYDGSEIHEAVLTLLSLDRAGAEIVCMAPDIEQMHVMNHYSQTESYEKRNVLIESARIARGDIENLADVIETDLVELGEEAISLSYSQSEETRQLTRELYLSVLRCIELLLLVLTDRDQNAASEILGYDKKIRELQDDLMIRKSSRLGHQDQAALKMARIEVSTSDKLARMYSLIKRITRENLDYPAGRSADYSAE